MHPPLPVRRKLSDCSANFNKLCPSVQGYVLEFIEAPTLARYSRLSRSWCFTIYNCTTNEDDKIVAIQNPRPVFSRLIVFKAQSESLATVLEQFNSIAHTGQDRKLLRSRVMECFLMLASKAIAESSLRRHRQCVAALKTLIQKQPFFSSSVLSMTPANNDGILCSYLGDNSNLYWLNAHLGSQAFGSDTWLPFADRKLRPDSSEHSVLTALGVLMGTFNLAERFHAQQYQWTEAQIKPHNINLALTILRDVLLLQDPGIMDLIIQQFPFALLTIFQVLSKIDPKDVTDKQPAATSNNLNPRCYLGNLIPASTIPIFFDKDSKETFHKELYLFAILVRYVSGCYLGKDLPCTTLHALEDLHVLAVAQCNRNPQPAYVIKACTAFFNTFKNAHTYLDLEKKRNGITPFYHFCKELQMQEPFKNTQLSWALQSRVTDKLKPSC